jgi:hypothetical protein
MLRDLQQKYGKSIGPASSNVTKIQSTVSLEQLKDDEDMIELCCQTAMMGALAGMEEEVQTVVGFLEALMPDSLKVMLTVTYCEMLFGRVHGAVTVLKNFVEQEHTDSVFANSFLNFAQVLAGDTLDVSVLEETSRLPKSPEQIFAAQALETLRKSKKIV